MPDYSTAKALEEKNILRTKTIYRTGAGRMQWGEGIEPKPRGSSRHSKSFKPNNEKKE